MPWKADSMSWLNGNSYKRNPSNMKLLLVCFVGSVKRLALKLLWHSSTYELGSKIVLRGVLLERAFSMSDVLMKWWGWRKTFETSSLDKILYAPVFLYFSTPVSYYTNTLFFAKF